MGGGTRRAQTLLLLGLRQVPQRQYEALSCAMVKHKISEGKSENGPACIPPSSTLLFTPAT